MTRGKRTRPLIEPDILIEESTIDLLEMPNDEPPVPIVINRTAAGTFAPGQSGNPRGRTPRDLDRYIREHLNPVAWFNGVWAIAQRGQSDALQAYGMLADRAWGKATAAIELSTSETDPAVQAMNRLAEVSRGLLATGSSDQG